VVTWAEDMVEASRRALATKGDPAVARDLDALTEWALMLTESATMIAGPHACADEEAARNHFGLYESVDGIELVSRFVMRTKWTLVR
jgi:hypothetical protein